MGFLAIDHRGRPCQEMYFAVHNETTSANDTLLFIVDMEKVRTFILIIFIKKEKEKYYLYEYN